MLVKLVIYLDALRGVVFEQQKQLFGKFKCCRTICRDDIMVGHRLLVNVTIRIGVVFAAPQLQLFYAVTRMVDIGEEAMFSHK